MQLHWKGFSCPHPIYSSCYHTNYLVLSYVLFLRFSEQRLSPSSPWTPFCEWSFEQDYPFLHIVLWMERIWTMVKSGLKLNYTTKKCCWSSTLEATEVKMRRKIYLMVHARWLPSCRIGPCAGLESFLVFKCLLIGQLSTRNHPGAGCQNWAVDKLMKQ